MGGIIGIIALIGLVVGSVYVFCLAGDSFYKSNEALRKTDAELKRKDL